VLRSVNKSMVRLGRIDPAVIGELCEGGVCLQISIMWAAPSILEAQN